MRGLDVRVSIVGLGLIGGSLGMALRRVGTPVIGYARRRETAERALLRGAIDAIAADWAAAAAADVVVVATPVLTVREIFAALAPHLAAGTIVSDVASTKAAVLGWADELLPAGVPFVGGHPMAGSEQSGIEAARADLFVGRTYCLCPSVSKTRLGERAGDGDVATVGYLAESVGARTVVLDAAAHDFLVAGISHLPLVASVALAAAVMGDAAWPQMAALAAFGFRDTTRLAAGDPTMGADILATNGAAVADWLDRLIAELSRWRDMIAAGDDASVRAELAWAQLAVRAWRKSAGYE